MEPSGQDTMGKQLIRVEIKPKTDPAAAVLARPNPYESLVERHPAVGDLAHNYWRLNSSWPLERLKERAEENRALAVATADAEYIEYLLDWLQREGFQTALGAETSSGTKTSGDRVGSASGLDSQELQRILNSKKLIKIEITPLIQALDEAASKNTEPKKKKGRGGRVSVPIREVEVQNPAHRRILALLGCPEAQITGRIPQAQLLTAFVKYVRKQGLQVSGEKGQEERRFFRLDANLRALLGLPDAADRCSYYDFQDHLLRNLQQPS